MSEVAVENINVAEILGAEGAEAKVKELETALVASPEVGPLVKAAETVEDVYEIVKKFAKGTLDQVKVIFQKTVDYFKETKAALSDEVLDNVSGGGFSSWWNQCKAAIISASIMVAAIAVGTVIGAATFGLGGALAGACAGAMIGAVAVTITNVAMEASENKNPGPKK